MRNTTILLTLFITLVLSPASFAQTPPLDLGIDQAGNVGIEILGHGIYEVQLAERGLEDNMTEAPMDDISKVVLLSRTNAIPLSKGTIFGYHYKLTGIPEGEQKTLSFELHHPVMITDEGEILSANSFEQTVFAGGTFHDLFVFEKDWEMEKGKYTFKIFFAGKEISSITFDVY